MSYLADGLQSGFQAGFSAGTARKEQKARDKLQAQRDALDQSRYYDQQSRQEDRDRTADARYALESKAQMQRDALALKASDSKTNDPREVLARTKASNELNTLQNPPPLSEMDRLKEKVARAKLEREYASTQAPAPVPTAKVRQPIGEKGFAEYEVPATDLEATVGKLQAGAYKSPFADQIADLTTKTASQQAAIDSGDNRTGFLGIGTSRAGIVDQSQKQLLRLRGQELQDMVQKGVINQAEADRRANVLMGVK